MFKSGIWDLRRNQKGFTLVELLVVISIIGVLATLVLLQLGTARARARDTKRITDVNQIRTSIEQYFEDNGGKYPISIDGSGCPSTGALCKYLTKVPVDPLTGLPYKYAFTSTAAAPTKYQVWAQLEQTAAALNGDADIVSTGWSGDANAVGSTDYTACSAGTVTSCVYDQGVQ